MKPRALFVFGDIAVFIANPHRYEYPDGHQTLEGEIILVQRNSANIFGETQEWYWQGSFLRTAKHNGLETIKRLCLAREDPDFLLWMAKSSPRPEAIQEAKELITAATAFGSALDEACGIADVEHSLDVAELEKLGIDWDEFERQVRRIIEEKEKNLPENE